MREAVLYTKDGWRIILSGSGTDEEKTVDKLKDLMAFLILDQQKKAEGASYWKQTPPFS